MFYFICTAHENARVWILCFSYSSHSLQFSVCICAFFFWFQIYCNLVSKMVCVLVCLYGAHIEPSANQFFLFFYLYNDCITFVRFVHSLEDIRLADIFFILSSFLFCFCLLYCHCIISKETHPYIYICTFWLFPACCFFS